MSLTGCKRTHSNPNTRMNSLVCVCKVMVGVFYLLAGVGVDLVVAAWCACDGTVVGELLVKIMEEEKGTHLMLSSIPVTEVADEES